MVQQATLSSWEPQLKICHVLTISFFFPMSSSLQLLGQLQNTFAICTFIVLTAFTLVYILIT